MRQLFVQNRRMSGDQRHLRQLKKKFGLATGFTLLELLVVISIIGLLVAISVAAFSVAQKRTRDARRTGDMKAMQEAMEQYYAANNSYPLTNSGGCTTLVNNIGASFWPGKKLVDPKNVNPYLYSCTTTASTYCLCADLENDVGNSSSTDCINGMGKGTSYFCVVNLQ